MTEIVHATSAQLLVVLPDGSTLYEGVAGRQGDTLAFAPVRAWSGYADAQLDGAHVRLAIAPTAGGRGRGSSLATATIIS